MVQNRIGIVGVDKHQNIDEIQDEKSQAFIEYLQIIGFVVGELQKTDVVNIVSGPIPNIEGPSHFEQQNAANAGIHKHTGIGPEVQPRVLDARVARQPNDLNDRKEK